VAQRNYRQQKQLRENNKKKKNDAKKQKRMPVAPLTPDSTTPDSTPSV
jgi:hypothetical protein